MPLPWIEAAVMAITAVTAAKHATWSYEREIRLIHIRRATPPSDPLTASIPTGELPNGEPIRWMPPLARSVGGKTVHYLEFPFGRFRGVSFDPGRSLKTVIIGPNCPLTKNDVVAALETNGFVDCAVEQSRCQIR
jgi:hypothetical protein